ncbi:hypothetical protein L2E82_32016 [Cichorium intybus]|uniref:Uncharacterized protein n=1 Tax=Cichorium intybus TaxID=13427 RepID=A0ACB9BGF2_CICIN|nr:hypothetical protein L2E82_32016 [Cichorium intybus]
MKSNGEINSNRSLQTDSVFKIEGEPHLPNLDSRDGISIAMEDIGTCQVWTMRYSLKFWPNNKSRMYLLENTEVLRTRYIKLSDQQRLIEKNEKEKSGVGTLSDSDVMNKCCMVLLIQHKVGVSIAEDNKRKCGV